MKTNPAGEAMMTNFSKLFSGAIGEGKGIKEFMKAEDMDQAHLKKPYTASAPKHQDNEVDSLRCIMSIIEEVI